MAQKIIQMQMRHLYFNLKDLFSNRKGFVILTSLLRFKNKSREFREQYSCHIKFQKWIQRQNKNNMLFTQRLTVAFFIPCFLALQARLSIFFPVRYSMWLHPHKWIFLTSPARLNACERPRTHWTLSWNLWHASAISLTYSRSCLVRASPRKRGFFAQGLT